jgi:hypothetical protein
MQTPKAFVLLSSLFACALFTANVQAGPLTYNVSANGADNPAGMFSGLSGQWNSGDLKLPSGTTIGSTPLQIDINLSQNLTLNNTLFPDGVEFYGLGVAGLSPTVTPGAEVAAVQIELFESGSPVAGAFGTTLSNPFSTAIANETSTGLVAELPVSGVFNSVEIFITDSGATAPQTISDFGISLGANSVGVPDSGNTLLLFFLGCGVVLGLARGRMPALCRQASR